MANELRDLIDDVETLAREARAALAGAKGDKATAGDLDRANDEAQAALDQLLVRLDRARVDGVVPR